MCNPPYIVYIPIVYIIMIRYITYISNVPDRSVSICHFISSISSHLHYFNHCRANSNINIQYLLAYLLAYLFYHVAWSQHRRHLHLPLHQAVLLIWAYLLPSANSIHRMHGRLIAIQIVSLSSLLDHSHTPISPIVWECCSSTASLPSHLPNSQSLTPNSLTTAPLLPPASL
jgi:hypothetical protein